MTDADLLRSLIETTARCDRLRLTALHREYICHQHASDDNEHDAAEARCALDAAMHHLAALERTERQRGGRTALFHRLAVLHEQHEKAVHRE